MGLGWMVVSEWRRGRKPEHEFLLFCLPLKTASILKRIRRAEVEDELKKVVGFYRLNLYNYSLVIGSLTHLWNWNNVAYMQYKTSCSQGLNAVRMMAPWSGSWVRTGELWMHTEIKQQRTNFWKLQQCFSNASEMPNSRWMRYHLACLAQIREYVREGHAPIGAGN